MKTETCRLYSSLLNISVLSNIINIDTYNFELHRDRKNAPPPKNVKIAN